ncbi:MAG: polysaccharide biosynthesis tyrosine autokinase [Microbacterium sp.]|uniref:polysaccharide biosynthesis tyrosine autokinase n=1 Tax=Microbacterium sp. TaxID=51671 RepID=UPI00282AC6D9|nr:polysaccharide biosynthesis tyrosine autokinase [Microbacterium sp.]MDR2322637.1 polysaccharide biosynthesis tyrosine autokinase [Microbacterium sp.]
MTVLDLFTLLRRGWFYLAAGLLLGALVGFGYAQTLTPVYTSQATGFIAATGTAVIAGSDEAVARAGAYMPLINTSQVRDEIAKEAGVKTSDLHGSLSARVVPGSTLVEVTADAADPKSALKLANGALHALAKVVAHIEDVAQSAAPADPSAPPKPGSSANTALGGIAIVPMDEAVAPTRPSAPNKPLIAGIGAGAGLVLGLIVLLLRRAMDVRVRAHTDVATLLGAGVLGRVPRMRKNGQGRTAELARAVAHEAYRQIRTGLRFASVDQEVRVVMVTSANLGEGKSETTRALARVLAESGQRTLVIDGDLRRPTIAKGFDIDEAIGLSEVLSGQVPIGSAIRRTEDPNLFVLPAGGIPPNPSEMLGSAAFQQLLARLRQDFFIVVDAPPVLAVTDASVLSSVVDGLVFVVAMGRTRRAELVEARTQLEQVRARILGVVLNLVSLRGGDNGYGYYRKNSRYYMKSHRGASAADEDDAVDALAAMANLSPAPLGDAAATTDPPRDDDAAVEEGTFTTAAAPDDITANGSREASSRDVESSVAERPHGSNGSNGRAATARARRSVPPLDTTEPVGERADGEDDDPAAAKPRYARRNARP